MKYKYNYAIFISNCRCNKSMIVAYKYEDRLSQFIKYIAPYVYELFLPILPEIQED